MKRGVEVQVIILQALFRLNQDTFFDSYSNVLRNCIIAAESLHAHSEMVQIIKTWNVMEEITQFDCNQNNLPLQVIIR